MAPTRGMSSQLLTKPAPMMPDLVFTHTQSDGREIFFGQPIGGRIQRVLPTVMVGIGFPVYYWDNEEFCKSRPILAMKVKRGTWTTAFDPKWEVVGV